MKEKSFPFALHAWLTLVKDADSNTLDALNLSKADQRKLVEGAHPYQQVKDTGQFSAQFLPDKKHYEFIPTLEGQPLHYLVGLAAHETHHFLNVKKGNGGITGGLVTGALTFVPAAMATESFMGGVAMSVVTALLYKGVVAPRISKHAEEAWAYRQQGIAQFAYDPDKVTMTMIKDEQKAIKNRKSLIGNYAETVNDIFLKKDSYPSPDKQALFIQQGYEHAYASGMRNEPYNVALLRDKTYRNIADSTFNVYDLKMK